MGFRAYRVCRAKELGFIGFRVSFAEATSHRESCA